MAKCQSYQEGKKQQEQLCDGCTCAPSVQNNSALLAMAVVPLELSSSSGRSTAEERALKIHSEAERRRRGRINAHLDTLRRMTPDAKQTDKATLLARVVEQVKSLKRKTTEITQSMAMAIPPKANEISIECYTGNCRVATASDDEMVYIRASISCNDRPDLIAALTGALHGLRLRALRTEMTCLGGKTQLVFILCKEEGNVCVCFRSLKEAARQAFAMAAFPEMTCGGSSSKRYC